MSKLRKPVEEEGGASWMDTYGDLVTLLLTFFVLLFSFSSIDAKKFQAMAGAFSGSTAVAIPALNPKTATDPPIQSLSPRSPQASAAPDSETAAAEAQIRKKFEELFLAIQDYIGGNNLNSRLSVAKNGDIVIVRFTDSVLFESGSSNIREEAIPIIYHVATILSTNMDVVEMVRIEGHTDNRPISTSRFADNWDLSTSRATNVLRYIISSELIELDKLSVVGYGELHPVDTNGTEEGRAANRRVDFVIESI